MYISTKRLFWSVALLAALLYAGAHFAVRSSWTRAQILRALSSMSGFSASASDVRLTPGLALSMEDFRLEAPDPAGGAPRCVFSARWTRLAKCGGAWRLRATNAALCAWRGADGLWVPSRATGADECPGACVFPRISSAFGNLYFDISDASVVFDNQGATTSYAGVSWTRRPVDIPGRPGAVQNVLSFLKGPVRSGGASVIASSGRGEWYEFGDSIARFVVAEPPALVEEVQPAPAEEAQSAPAGDAQPAPAEEAQPAPAEEAQPAPVEEAQQPAPAEEAQPAPAEEAPQPAPAPEAPVKEGGGDSDEPLAA